MYLALLYTDSVFSAGGYKEMSSILADHCALVYAPKFGGKGRVAGTQPMSTAVQRSPNKLWRSNSIFNLRFRELKPRRTRLLAIVDGEQFVEKMCIYFDENFLFLKPLYARFKLILTFHVNQNKSKFIDFSVINLEKIFDLLE
jgi:hypothetical protein